MALYGLYLYLFHSHSHGVYFSKQHTARHFHFFFGHYLQHINFFLLQILYYTIKIAAQKFSPNLVYGGRVHVLASVYHLIQ